MLERDFTQHVQTLSPEQQLEYIEGVRASALEAHDIISNYTEEGLLRDAILRVRRTCQNMFGSQGLELTDLSMRGSRLAVALSDVPGSYISVSHFNEEFIYTFSANNKTVSVFRERELR